ncbi:MAG: lamin tail domain-containing protein, partial [Kiritimatiellae bacterium]|nr:lamin tail domain-containing protein [Kiritimatiellia bacterium]
MKRASQRRIRLCSSILLVLFLLAGVCAHAESLITKASTWRYAKGTAEASDPRSDWRNQDFDDSGWATGQAPFGYGEAGLNTTLGDMQNTYACFFLRKTFTVTSMPAELRLRAAADYDDGFIVWINGERVWDKCEPDGEPLYSSMAAMGHESGLFETNGLGAPGDYLEIGENVVAVQVFNAGIDSSDCVFDMALSSYNQVADTRFSADRGFYDAAFYVTISTDTAGATIRYTTDGTAPSASFGTAGGTNAVLHITSTTCLRVGAFKSGYEPTNIDTHTYIFLADVILQSGRPSGYPSKWGRTADGQIPADYDMDPDVRNDPNYGSAGVRNAMASLPSLSIVMDKVDMFGSAGVYNFNSNTSTENVEKATSVELIYPPGFPLKHAGGFQADCGITPHSHGPVYRPKRSFRLYFRREYGTTKLRYPFMESAVFHADSGADTFDRLVLRSGNNRAWTYPRIDTRFNVYVADQWGRTGQLDMSGYGCRGVYVHVYINGMYWGLYDVAERMDDFWAASYFGGEPEDWGWGNHGVGAEGWDVADPADDRWQYLVETLGGRDMTVAANYEEMKEYLDLEGFCDYITLQWYVGAGDWPDANFYYVNRNTPTPTPGRYLCWDPEWSWYERRGWCNDGAWVHPRFLTSGEGSLWPYSSTANKFQPKPFRSLIRNTDFRTLFADRVYKHLQNDGALIDQNSKARYSALCDRIEEGIIGEEARWGDHTCPWGVTNADNSVTTINRFGRNRYLYSGPAHDGAGHYLTNWYSARDYALGLMNGNGDRLITACKNQTMNGYKLYPSLDPPTFHQHGGAIATGFKLTLSNPNSTGTVYYTLDGTDPRVAGGARSGTRYTGALTLSKTTHVKARVYKSDSTWSAVHAATYNYTAHYDRIRITEILYNPLGGGEFEFVEVKNTGSAPRGLSDMSFKGVRYTFPPGTELGPGEFAVLASDEAVFTARYPGVKEAVAHFGVYAGRLDNGGERISLLDSDGVTVTSVRYNDKDPWPAAADGDGFALVAVDTAGDQDDPAKWRAGNLIGGSPGYDDGPAYRVVVSEALTHTDPPRKDAIELHNAGETAADIGGWYLSDSAADYRKFRIPAGTTLAAGGYAVFDETDFNADTNSPACFALDSHGDEVCLTHWDARGNLLYLAEARFGGAANGVAFARHVRSDGEPDFVAQSTPTTLGGANAYPQVGPVVINEIMYNPAGLSGEFVELLNIGGTAVKLYDPGNPATGWRLSAAVDYSFPQGTELSPGEIVLVVPTNEAAFRAQYPGVPGAVRIFGPYTGRLGNGGESLKLWQPDTPDAEGTPWLLVDRVQYNDNSPWPEGADGDGPSLER